MVHKLLPLCLVFPLFGSAVMLAQECTNQFNRAVWHPEQGLISASVMHPLHPTEQSSAKWLLLDSTGNLPVDLAPVLIRNYGDPDHPDIPPPDPSVSIYLMPVQPLLINHLYYLRAQNVRTTGCPK